MTVVYSFEALPHSCPLPVATIGNFDGVHLGHQSLMADLVERARSLKGTSTVVTFHPHPLQILAPNHAPRQIQTLPQKLAAIESTGIQLIVVIPFNLELAQMRAREFAIDILYEKLGLHEIHVGPNFAFGHRREGSFVLLKEIGEERGFAVGKVHQIQFRGSRVSSTLIRQALLSGEVALARRMLGRPYALSGKIIHGAALGTELRVPTANLDTNNELIPRRGVYATALRVGGTRHWSVTNIGTRPTVSDPRAEPQMTIETHVLDFQKDLYGQEVTVEFLLRLRDEHRFADAQALVAQIKKDVGKAMRYFRWSEKSAAPSRQQPPQNQS
jgi:riboflavin kinase/FMN adenylyltransferase